MRRSGHPRAGADRAPAARALLWSAQRVAAAAAAVLHGALCLAQEMAVSTPCFWPTARRGSKRKRVHARRPGRGRSGRQAGDSTGRQDEGQRRRLLDVIVIVLCDLVLLLARTSGACDTARRRHSRRHWSRAESLREVAGRGPAGAAAAFTRRCDAPGSRMSRSPRRPPSPPLPPPPRSGPLRIPAARRPPRAGPAG